MTMSKQHPYRIQLHCDRQMHSEINKFANQRGLSQSGAARILIDRSLVEKNDELVEKINEITRLLQAVLHAAAASRVFASEAAQGVGANVSNDEFKQRIINLVKRYNGNIG